MASVTTEFAKLTQDERAEIKEQFYTVSLFYIYWLERKTGFGFCSWHMDRSNAHYDILSITCRLLFLDVLKWYLQQLIIGEQ